MITARIIALLLLFVGPTGIAADGDLPLFDGHIHYNGAAWDSYPVAAALRLLAEAGISKALVSSTPNEGTVRLYEADPGRIVPELRPYRELNDMATWFDNSDTLRLVEQELKRGIYKGVGELHLSGAHADTPVVRRLVALAVEHDLPLHAHSDALAVERLFSVNPKVKILWAHAGMTETTATVGRMLENHPLLWVELSYRSDVTNAGRLDPGWRDLFVHFPDRFITGSDTWTPSRWAEVPALAKLTRGWLRELPQDVAEKIAYGNAARLYP
jgi:amidohydrolase family protein